MVKILLEFFLEATILRFEHVVFVFVHSGEEKFDPERK